MRDGNPHTDTNEGGRNMEKTIISCWGYAPEYDSDRCNNGGSYYQPTGGALFSVDGQPVAVVNYTSLFAVVSGIMVISIAILMAVFKVSSSIG